MANLLITKYVSDYERIIYYFEGKTCSENEEGRVSFFC